MDSKIALGKEKVKHLPFENRHYINIFIKNK